MQSSNFVSNDNGGQIQMELYSFDDLNEVEEYTPGVTVHVVITTITRYSLNSKKIGAVFT